MPVAAISTKRDRKTTFCGELRAAIQDSSVRRCSAEMGSGSATSTWYDKHSSDSRYVKLFMIHTTCLVAIQRWSGGT
jgi:hypothetical protein